MNPGAGGPSWANPDGNPPQATMTGQESDFFAPLSTLDEPVRETIMRDVRSVVTKLKVVMLPLERTVSTRCRFCSVARYTETHLVVVNSFLTDTQG